MIQSSTSDDGREAITAPSARRRREPIIPADSVASRSLFFVVAIMSFLACITVGAVAVVTATAADWRSEIAQEITVQVRPGDDVDTDAAVAEVIGIVEESEGVRSARPLDDEEIGALLEPWLGAGADLDALPVPRLVVIEIDQGSPPDMAAMRTRLRAEVPSASLDDHDMWQGRLRVMANTLIFVGGGVLVLVLVATVLSVVFATRGAMASNRDVVEVLHLVGAKEAFIARQFARHFLRLGLKGGIAGGTTALLAFGAIRFVSGRVSATPAGDQVDALFGAISIGWSAVVGIVGTVALVAALTALTSRIAVFRFLKVFD